RFSRRTSGTDLREHGVGAQRSAPRPKVLGAVARAEPFVEIVVDIARRQVAPAAPAALESKETCSGCTELPLHEIGELTPDHHLPLSLVPLPHVRKNHAVALNLHVRLPQRRDAVGAILACVSLAPNTAETLADETQHCSGDRGARERASRGARLFAQHAADARQRLRQLADLVILAQFTTFHRAA